MGIPTKIGSDHTVDDGSSISITSGIDSTYDEYMFVCTDIHNNTDDNNWGFQFNASGGSGYDETITSTWFYVTHPEDDSSTSLTIGTADLAQETTFQITNYNMNSDADASMVGILHLFNPSNTTYVKHFYFRLMCMENSPAVNEIYISGYINTTAAIDEIQFKPSSGTFDGTIQMYGIA
jgi:hypothetical protein